MAVRARRCVRLRDCSLRKVWWAVVAEGKARRDGMVRVEIVYETPWQGVSWFILDDELMFRAVF